MRAGAAIERTGAAVGEATRDVRSAWGHVQTAGAAMLVLAALLPVFAPASLTLDGLAGSLYVAVAAVGLAFAVGLAGMPSLAQGAFVGVGAVTAALVRVHWGWPPLGAALAGAAVATAAGVVVGAGFGRLRPAFIAVGTWIVAWIVSFALLEFPELSGGAQGLVVPEGEVLGLELTPTVHYEIALALLALAALAFTAVARGRAGNALSALRQRPAAASALGVPAFRLRVLAFALAAAVAGLAGGFGVQLTGVSDPASYGPFLSFTIFVAVLLGGARSAPGVIAGALAVELIFYGADRLASIGGLATGRLDALVAAMVLLYVLGLDSEGLGPAALARLRRAGRASPRAAPRALDLHLDGAPRLAAHGLEKRFGEVVGVAGLDLDVRGGTITALIGPNGSGKTTALRLLSGTMAPDAGALTLDGRAVADATPRGRALAGIVRTLQATSVFGDLTALENVLVGAGLRSRSGGVFRTLLSTPRSRREARSHRETALAALDELGLVHTADTAAAELPGSEQRLLMLAAAIASQPRILLVDEPSAGASPDEVARVAASLERLRGRGLGLLVVEHNLRLVRRIADHVVVLEAGRPIAAGTPDEVAADPLVRTAYLGRRAL